MCSLRSAALAVIVAGIAQAVLVAGTYAAAPTDSAPENAPDRTGEQRRQQQRPNIVFIMTDDHAAQALSAYGSDLIDTPHLDRIAREGMRFNNGFVTNSLCGPSRASIITGTYSHVHGFMDNQGDKGGGFNYEANPNTFPELLQQAGYQTAIVGKWHLGADPKGFDYWNVLPGQGAYVDPVMIEQGQRRKFQGYTTDLIGDFTLDWMEDQRDPDQPFCLFFWHKAPHRNWTPGPEEKDLFAEDLPVPETFHEEYDLRGVPQQEQRMMVRQMGRYDLKQEPPSNLEGEALAEWKYQRYIKDYLRTVAGVDKNVGRLLDYLDENGLAENTIVVYTSDNGFFLGEHGWFDKRFMYEESLRVPLMVRYPKAVEPGTVTDAMALNIDFMPTFLDYAGIAIPESVQGRSLRPVLESKSGDAPKAWRDEVYYHYYEYPGPHHVYPHYGVRNERYKLIHFYTLDDYWELYDLEEDPQELNNVYGNTEYQKVVEKLKNDITRLQVEYRDDDPTISPAELRQRRQMEQIRGQQPVEIFSAATPDTGGVDKDLDPSLKPITVGARVTPEGDGVIAAHGGMVLGYSLYLKDRTPHFTVRNGRAEFTVKADVPLPAGESSHVIGMLDRDSTLRLYVDGELVATTKGLYLDRAPAEGLSIGMDDGDSRVADYGGHNAFEGDIRNFRLYWGIPEAETLRTWAGSR